MRVSFGERRRDVFGFAGTHADDSRNESGDEASLRQFGRFARSAPTFKSNAVDFPLVIEGDDVAELGATFDRNEHRALLRQSLQTALDIVVGHHDRRARDRNALVSPERDLRPDFDGGFDPGGTTVGLFEHLHLGTADRLEIVLADRLGVDLRHDFFHRLTGDGVGTVGLLEDLARHFALAKAG